MRCFDIGQKRGSPNLFCPNISTKGRHFFGPPAGAWAPNAQYAPEGWQLSTMLTESPRGDRDGHPTAADFTGNAHVYQPPGPDLLRMSPGKRVETWHGKLCWDGQAIAKRFERFAVSFVSCRILFELWRGV